MTDTRLIDLPLGLPGSGRARYGAAMALWRDGALSAEALEVYRICAARDGDDPAPLLAARGLAGPARRAVTADRILLQLLDESDRYLATLSGPGIAEVRTGFAHARAMPCTPPAPAGSPVVAAHLDTALAALAEERPALAAAIAAAAPILAWTTYDEYPRDRIGAAFAEGHAFASFVGEGAAFAAQDFDAGLFLIAPGVLYRDRRHPAPELYAPLTGPHGWRFAPGAPLVVKPAHRPVWNEALRPHLTKVGPVPFLALFAWTRDVNRPAEVLPAGDWAALEAMTLAV